MYQFPQFDITTRGITPFEKDFIGTMVEHYRERVKQYPSKLWLKQSLWAYQNQLATSSIPCYDKEQ